MHKFISRLVLIFSLVLVCLAPTHQTASAVFNIQAAIDSAPDGGTVSIGAGTFSQSLIINKNLTLVGASSTETILNPGTAAGSSPRIISIGSGVTVHLNNLSISGANVAEDVGGGVLSAAGSHLYIDHCVLTQNQAQYGGAVFQKGQAGSLTVTNSTVQSNSAAYHGGGLYAEGNLTLTDTWVLDNQANFFGGGAYSSSGTLHITGGSFENNHANQDGGGLNVNNALILEDVTFYKNIAGTNGGGVMQWNSGHPVTLTHVTFSNNSAVNNGGGMFAKGNLTVNDSMWTDNEVNKPADSGSNAAIAGGGLALENATLLMHRSTFHGNQLTCSNCSVALGGGISLRQTSTAEIYDSKFDENDAWNGGGISADTNCSLKVKNGTFTLNTAGYGGGINAYFAEVRSSLFQNNIVVNSGGAMMLSGATLDGLRISGNQSGVHGGGLWIGSTGSFSIHNSVVNGNSIQSSGTGSGIYIENGTSAELLQNTIANNTGGDGSGIFVAAGNPQITNNIVTGQTLGICSKSSQTVTVDGVLWYNNTLNGGGASCQGMLEITHSLTGSPAFAPDGYHITRSSAAYNAGVASGSLYDLDGDTRPQFGAFDLGADEYIARAFLPMIRR